MFVDGGVEVVSFPFLFLFLFLLLSSLLMTFFACSSLIGL